MNNLPWNKRLRKLEFRPPYADPERLVGYLKEMNVNAFVISATDASTGFSLYPSKMSPMCKLVDENYLNDLIKRCHDANIMVSSWYDPRGNGVMWNQKPEWRMLVKDSNDDQEHPGNDVMCFISSPYKEWVYTHLEEIVSRFDFDGLFFDCSTFGYYGGSAGCYCDWCKSAFLKKTGYDIPQMIEWGSPETDLYIQWRYDTYNEWLLTLRDRLLKIKKDLVIELNVLNRPHVLEMNKNFNWKTGIKLQTLPEGISAGSESDSGIYRLCSANQAAAHSRAMDPKNWSLWMPALNATFENRAGVCFFDEAPSIDTFEIHAATALSKGGVPWYGIDLLTKTRRERLKETYAFIRQREACLGDVLVKDIAIHFGNSSRDYYGKHDVENYYAGILGFFEAATEMHYPVDYIFDDQMNKDNMKDYRVLILSNSACLTKTQISNIGSFVRQGGTLVVTHYSSLIDENKHHVDSFGLKDILGIDFGSFSSNEKGSAIFRYSGHESAESEVSVLRNTACIDVKIPEKSSAKVLATINYYDCEFTPFFKAAVDNTDYDQLAIDNYFEIPAGSNQNPVITQNKYGDGQVFYCGFDIGRTYLKNPYPGTRKIIQNMIDGGSDARIHLKAPKSIEFSAMESIDRKKLFLHVVNAPATNTKCPGWHTMAAVVDEILPVYGLVAEIKGRVPKTAVHVLTGKPCRIEQTDSCYQVHFDCTGLHEIIQIE